MCRFDSEGDGFNGGMTRREPGDVVGIPVTGRLGREIVRERGSYDMNSIEVMLKLMLILMKSNVTKKIHYQQRLEKKFQYRCYYQLTSHDVLMFFYVPQQTK